MHEFHTMSSCVSDEPSLLKTDSMFFLFVSEPPIANAQSKLTKTTA